MSEFDLSGLDTDGTGQISPIEQDTIAEIGNISMGAAATALSTLVNRKVRITVPEVFVSYLSKIQESYPIPCVIVNVQYLKGLQGENILVIREQDALVIGNLMMGEDGLNPPDQLDEIYLSAVTEAMNMMMGSASTAMSDLFNNLIDISPPTTERRDLAQVPLTKTVNPQTPIVAVAFRIEIDDLVDSTMLQLIEIEFAKTMVEKLMPAEEETAAAVAASVLMEDSVEEDLVSPAAWNDLKPTDAAQPNQTPPTFLEQESLGNVKIDLIKDIPVQVRAVLGRTKMTIDNILRLGPGHIMELDSLHGEPIEVYANDTLIAKGEVVVVGEQFGIRITEIAAQKERIVSVR